ncbi:CPBP family intramembrane glutamic endopeptidase [Paraburkholderia phenazinium]|nr:CPBP family intramembrane glutamic endopeptidase [Paraburkholderia phenazinium]
MDDSLMQSAEQSKNDTPAARRKQRLRWVFLGPNGIRAGWGIVVFIAAFMAVNFCVSKLLHFFFGHIPHSATDLSMPTFYLGECSLLICLAGAVAVVSTIERRSILSFGLQGSAGWARFAGGLICGFGAISLVVLIFLQMHLLTLDPPSTHGATLWTHGIAWGGAFLLVALAEESALRGYLQYTLTRGVGFWWGALLLSILFGGLHGSNPGETPVGLISAGGFGIVLCLSLWYTGSLFWAIGFHAAWDWGQSYFYGTSDSGTLLETRLYTAHPLGNILLSGGKTGPEGSLLVLVLLVVMGLAMWLWWGRRTTSPFSGSGWRPARTGNREPRFFSKATR